MRKKTILLYIVSTLALTMAIAPIVSAKSNKLLKCDIYMDLNWDFIGFGVGDSPWSWIGTISGDINGDLYVGLTEAWFPAPGTEHFTENWRIETYDGEVIEGNNKGKWTMANYKWGANGEVLSATGEWAYLVGSRMHYGGTTTEFPVPYGTPVSGTGKLQITYSK